MFYPNPSLIRCPNSNRQLCSLKTAALIPNHLRYTLLQIIGLHKIETCKRHNLSIHRDFLLQINTLSAKGIEKTTPFYKVGVASPALPQPL